MDILRSLEDLTIESNKKIQQYFSEKVYEVHSSDIKALYDYGQSPLELSMRRNLKKDGFKNVGGYLSYSNGKDYLTLTINLDNKNPHIKPFEVKPTEALLTGIKILETACISKSEEKTDINTAVIFGFYSTDIHNEPCILDLAN